MNYMLIYLAQLDKYFSFLHIFKYLSFRAVLAFLISFCMWLILGGRFIAWLKSWQKRGQPISVYMIAYHREQKQGTPTMGGLMLVGNIILSIFLCCELNNAFVWICLICLISFSIIGIIDDYKKIYQQANLGITIWHKFALQVLLAFVLTKWLELNVPPKVVSATNLPFLKATLLNLSYFYIPFAMCVCVGSSNAVNITDGLDGLAAGILAINLSTFALIVYLSGNYIFSRYLTVPYIPGAGEVAIVCAGAVGSCLGFLWYNVKPAKVFMGDTGSLPLGALLGLVSLIAKQELLLILTGIIFVIEVLSVIAQVISIKTRGKKLFLMAPIHHHFEKKGWSETEIVLRFWLFTIVSTGVALLSLKIR